MADKYPPVMSVSGIVGIFTANWSIGPALHSYNTDDKNQYSVIRDITFPFHPFFLLLYITHNATEWHQWRQDIRLHAASSGATKGFTLFSHICSQQDL